MLEKYISDFDQLNLFFKKNLLMINNFQHIFFLQLYQAEKKIIKPKVETFIFFTFVQDSFQHCLHLLSLLND